MLCMDGSDGFMLLLSSSLLLLMDVEDLFNFKVDVDFGMLLLEQSSWGCLASVIFLFVSSSCVTRSLSFLFE